MADKKLGIWLIGACGNVATTVSLGLLALQKGLAPPVGLVTELPDFATLPMVDWPDLVIGGHDIREPGMIAAAERLAAERVVPSDLISACRDELADLESRILPGVAYHAGDAIRNLAEYPLPDDASVAPRQLVSQLQRDFQAFIDRHALRSVVVVNLASTEPPFTGQTPATWPELEPLLDVVGTELPASSLYAIAAMELGLPFVNFTPSTGSSLSAVEDLAKRKKNCHAGQDGKTGETLLKTVLAPMFSHRNLDVLSWVGHNIFGNLDGRILDNPANRAAKATSKNRVLEGTLGYDPQTLVSIEYIQSLGDWKTAWDHIHFRGFLGTQMTMQFTWQGADSALAAPLVLDLVRLVDLAARDGQSGAIGAFSAFFKSPLGSTQHDFAQQHATLLDWTRDVGNRLASQSAE